MLGRERADKLRTGSGPAVGATQRPEPPGWTVNKQQLGEEEGGKGEESQPEDGLF